MHDWKLSALVVVTLPGWGYHEKQLGRISKARHPWRSIIRGAVSAVRQLLVVTHSEVS